MESSLDWHKQLCAEFAAAEGSFLIQLRCDLTWDTQAFEILINAMKHCCETNSKSHHLERQIAEGFYYIPGFTRGWISQYKFKEKQQQPYYDRSLEILDELAYWYFSGEPMMIDGLDLSLPR
ncbi:MAG: hypothetical protein GY927_22560 [bacterium]|nr:hypothetical protein [bacterium]